MKFLCVLIENQNDRHTKNSFLCQQKGNRISNIWSSYVWQTKSYFIETKKFLFVAHNNKNSFGHGWSKQILHDNTKILWLAHKLLYICMHRRKPLWSSALLYMRTSTKPVRLTVCEVVVCAKKKSRSISSNKVLVTHGNKKII